MAGGLLAAFSVSVSAAEEPVVIQHTLALPVRDVAWPAGATRFLASIPDSADEHGGEVVWVDPVSGAIEPGFAIPGGISETTSVDGRLGLSPSGEFLFVVAGDGLMIQAWNLADRQMTKLFRLPEGEKPLNFAVAAAQPFRLLAAMDNGSMIPQPALLLDEQFHALRIQYSAHSPQTHVPQYVVAHPTEPETFFTYAPYRIQIWRTGPAGVEASQELRTGPYALRQAAMVVMDGRLFCGDGAVWDLETGQQVGALDLVPYSHPLSIWRLLAADRRRQEIVVLSPNNNNQLVLRGYHASDLSQRREAVLPLHVARTQRLLLGGRQSGVLVVNDTAYLLRWPPTLEGAGEVDLSLTAASLTAPPRIGVDWEWQVTVTNASDHAASKVTVRCLLPAGMDWVGVEPASILAHQEDSVVTLSVPEVAGGAAAQFRVTVRPLEGGWVTNRFNVMASEDDVEAANNQAAVVDFVAPSSDSEAADILHLSVAQLVFDPERRLLHALERPGEGRDITRLLRLDPDTFEPAVFREWPEGGVRRLRQSADGRFLYVAIRHGMAFVRIDLTEELPDLVFDLRVPDQEGGDWACVDFVVAEDDPRTIVALAVNSENGLSPAPQAVLVSFTEGQANPRTVLLPEGVSGEFHLHRDAPTGRILLATQAKDGRGGVVEWLYTFRVEAAGVVPEERWESESLRAGFLPVGERLYAWDGRELTVIDGRLIRRLPRRFTSAYGMLAYVPATDRLAFFQSSGSQYDRQPWELQVYDRQTFGRAATMSTPFAGWVEGMVALDGGRLAADTRAGKLMVIRTPALGPAGDADLAAQLLVSPEPPLDSGPLVTLRIQVRNIGTVPVDAPVVTCELPPGFQRDLLVPSPADGHGHGLWPLPLVWQLPTLAPGETNTISIFGRFMAVGSMTVAAGVTGETPETERADNYVTRTLDVIPHLEPGRSVPLAFSGSDAVYDPAGHRVLVVVTGNHPRAGQLVVVDPDTGLIVGQVDVGGVPVLLARSADGSLLYVAIDEGARVVRVHLPSLAVEPPFALHSESGRPAKVWKLLVNPGNPEELVIFQSDNWLSLYRQGEWITGMPMNGNGEQMTFFAPDRLIAARLGYPFGFRRYHLTESAIELEAEGGDLRVSRLQAVHGLICIDRGVLVDPLSFQPVGHLGTANQVLWDPVSRTFFRVGHFWGIYDDATQTPLVGPLPVAGKDWVEALPIGSDLFLIRDREGQLYLLRSDWGVAGPDADLSVELRLDPDWRAGELCGWSVTVRNEGEHPAPAVRLDHRLPDSLRFVEASIPAATAGDGHLTFQLGGLEPGAAREIRVMGVALSAGLASELVVSARSGVTDSQWTNNVARQTAAVGLSLLANRLDELPLRVWRAVYAPNSNLLLLACEDEDAEETYRLVALDLNAGRVVGETALSGRPACLAISDDETTLYAGVDSGAEVHRFALPELTWESSFASLRSTDSRSLNQCDLVVLPGHPEQVVVSRFGLGSPSPGGAWLYDEGEPRPAFIPAGYGGITSLAEGMTPEEVIAIRYSTSSAPNDYRLQRVLVSPDGLALAPEAGGSLTFVNHPLYAGGNYLLHRGRLFDRRTLESLGDLPVPFSPDSEALSADGHRALFAHHTNRARNPVDLALIRTDDRTLVGTQQVPGSGQVLLWGEDGLALAGNSLVVGRLDWLGPERLDTDGDGLPDFWEARYGLNSARRDAAEDPDGDGASNLLEFYCDSDPRVPEADGRLHVTQLTGGELRLWFRCRAGVRFRLERTDDPVAGVWTEEQAGVSLGGWQVYAVTTQARHRFFRFSLTAP